MTLQRLEAELTDVIEEDRVALGFSFYQQPTAFRGLFRPSDDPDDVVLDFRESRVLDHSALEAINDVSAKYAALGKRVHLRRLSSDCYQLLEKLNGKMADYATYELLLEADAATDPVYEVAVDYSKYGTVKPPTEDRRP